MHDVDELQKKSLISSLVNFNHSYLLPQNHYTPCNSREAPKVSFTTYDAAVLLLERTNFL